jgi:pyruvate,water dikinase
MLRAGFPVPEGFVLTTEAFNSFLNANELDDKSSQGDVVNGLLPTEIEDQLQNAFAPFYSESLAVRSSGTSEDLEDASFAGQYETILDVQGFNNLSSAVRKCWASAFSERVEEYIAQRREINRGGMAVLVQQLVKADAAGVAFSANPVTGNRDECVINSVKGLGERLVSGQATPDEWIVHGKNVKSISSPEKSITETQALAVADMARKAEAHFKEPQDIEWAIQEGNLFMLQARPITALPEQPIQMVPVPIDPPPGFWEKEMEHCPDPLSPLFRTSVLPFHEKAIEEIMEEYSILIDGIQFRLIGGWLYTKVVPLGGKEGPPPPAWLLRIIMPLVIRFDPSMRKRVNGLIKTIKTDLPSKNLERWYNEWKPNNIERISQFKLVEPQDISNEQLTQHLSKLLSFQAECSRTHARLTGADMLIADFVLTSKKIIEWEERKSLELLSGLSLKTTEPTRRMGELAQLAKNNSAVLELLNNITPVTVEKLSSVDNEFAESFEKYMKEFGDRTLCWEINKETLEERPELVLKLIHDQVFNDYNFESEAAVLEKKREKTLNEAKDALSALSSEMRKEFELALEKAERAYPVREDHEYYLHNAPLALLRKAFLEIGNRLVTQGLLNQADDIFFLELDEAFLAFDDGLDKRDTVTHRKGELAWALANPGPLTYGGPPAQPPPLDGFPKEVKRVMEGMMWMIEGNTSATYLQQQGSTSSQTVTGLAASPGQYTGPVRIIMSEEEFYKLEPGDVLVCPTTQPPWSVLFPSVGALVTDGGGILSHPAIIAREYQVPAIVATRNATSILHDGQIVTVNGDTGKINFD